MVGEGRLGRLERVVPAVRRDGQRARGDRPAIANTEREGIQRFSTVAMDVDGDFVITWQSQGQDESGYGVYAQRYTRAGELLGGLDEIQVIEFVGDPDLVEFALDIDGQVTGPITYTGSLSDVADQLEAEFALLGYDVEARVIADTEVAIRFVGDDGRTDQPPIVIDYATVAGDDAAKITISTLVEGEVSEFLVNDATAGDQMFPSIAMDTEGNFLISWTVLRPGRRRRVREQHLRETVRQQRRRSTRRRAIFGGLGNRQPSGPGGARDRCRSS